jgi:hypothetical protein
VPTAEDEWATWRAPEMREGQATDSHSDVFRCFDKLGVHELTGVCVAALDL